MDRKMMVIAAISVAVASLAITAVTASPWASDTPLYTFRMEQASSKMNFLPTEMNQFTYTAENGYTLDYEVVGYCSDVKPLDTGVWTCYYSTCGGPTCWLTCPASCYGTCNDPTCGSTCVTCPWTCGGSCDTCVTKPC
ncbi:MAG: hypothetical protein HXS48_01115 [Theionarchaea archaeon]|nr:hypothetical protein [Theionarchaea archaeon]